jgi:uncharacterized protein with PIN domain
MESTFVNPRVHAAREQLALAQGQIDAAVESGTKGLDGAVLRLKDAQKSIDELSRQIDVEKAEEPEMKDCPACHKSIRKAASLCGYCWKKL